jgi:hypothetical protein
MQDIPLEPNEPLSPEFIAQEVRRIDELEHRPNARRAYCAERDVVFREMQLIEAMPEEDWCVVPSSDLSKDYIRLHWNIKQPSVFRLKTNHCGTSARVVSSIIVDNPATVRVLWSGADVKSSQQLENFEDAHLQIIDMVVRPNFWSMKSDRRFLGLFWHRNDPARRTNLFIWKSTEHRRAPVKEGVVDVTGWFGILVHGARDADSCEVTVYACLDYHPSAVLRGWMHSLIKTRLPNMIAEWESFARFKIAPTIDLDGE